MADTRLEAHQKNEFYRDYFEQVIFGLMAVIITALLLVMIVFYQVYNRPLPQFNAVAQGGKTMVLTPYDAPNVVPGVLLKWASKAAVAAYTFDFVNYAKETGLARPYFTADGWQAYQSAIASVIQRVVKGQLFVSGVVAGTPVISNQGDLMGHGYTWRVQIPFLVTYQSAEEVKTQHYTVVMMIVKVPTNITPEGIGIDQFDMR